MQALMPSPFEATTKPKDEVRRQLMEVDLDCIKFKLMDSHEGLGWTREQAEAVSEQYRRFLFLCVTTGTSIVPTKDVDEFWHQHILDTHKYADDCHRIFGFFLHHFPYLGMRGEEDAQQLQRAFAHTRKLYEAEFGQPYGMSPQDCENCGSCTSSCGVCSGSGSCSSQDMRPTLPSVTVS